MMLAKLVSSGSSEGQSIPCLFLSFLWLPATLNVFWLELHNSHLYLHFHMASWQYFTVVVMTPSAPSLMTFLLPLYNSDYPCSPDCFSPPFTLLNCLCASQSWDLFFFFKVFMMCCLRNCWCLNFLYSPTPTPALSLLDSVYLFHDARCVMSFARKHFKDGWKYVTFLPLTR